MEFFDSLKPKKRSKSKQTFGKNGWAVQPKSKYPAASAAQQFKFPQHQKNLNESDEFKQKRPPHDTTFQNLVEIAANRFGFGKQLGSIRICHEARKILSAHFPSSSSEQIRVVSFQDGTLQLASNSSTWAHQLMMKKHQIMVDLNQKLGEDIIRRINLRTISAPSSEQ